MSYSLLKWTIFLALFITVPSLLFLIQVVMFVPAIFFAVGILFMVPKAFTQSNSAETISFIVIFGIHLIVYFGFYYLVSVLAAKFISIFKSKTVKLILLSIIIASLAILTQLPLYGGGGHGPIDWVTLPELIMDFTNSFI